jgi:enterochelin esterase-like enzyme
LHFVQAQVPVPSKGKVVRHEMFASRFVKSRHIDVWLPADYTPTKRYAVLYMHDGQNLFDGTQTFNHQEWKVDETMDSLLHAGAIPPCIVVGIWNTNRRRTEYFPAKPFFGLSRAMQDTLRSDLGDKTANPESDAYLKFIVQELKPFVDSTYSTYTDRRHTFIAGSSMGGLISMYAICEYPNMFGGAACISTHWPGSVFRNNPAIAQGFDAYMKKSLPSPRKHRFYFDYGTATLDAWYEPYQKMIDVTMQAKGYGAANWMTRKFEGAEHSEIAWQRRLRIPLVFLMGKK